MKAEATSSLAGSSSRLALRRHAQGGHSQCRRTRVRRHQAAHRHCPARLHHGNCRSGRRPHPLTAGRARSVDGAFFCTVLRELLPRLTAASGLLASHGSRHVRKRRVFMSKAPAAHRDAFVKRPARARRRMAAAMRCRRWLPSAVHTAAASTVRHVLSDT